MVSEAEIGMVKKRNITYSTLNYRDMVDAARFAGILKSLGKIRDCFFSTTIDFFKGMR